MHTGQTGTPCHANFDHQQEANYSYTGTEGECMGGKLKNYTAQITGYRRTDNASELTLMAAVARQPVAVSMSLDAAVKPRSRPRGR